MATANLKLIQSCYKMCLSQFYTPKKYEEGSINIILDVIAVLPCYRILPAKL